MDSTLESFWTVRISGKVEPTLDIRKTGRLALESGKDAAWSKAVEELRKDPIVEEKWERWTAEEKQQAIEMHLGRVAIGKFLASRDISTLAFDGEPAMFHVQRPDPVWLAESCGSIHVMAARRHHAFRSLVHCVKRGETILVEAVKPDRASGHKHVLTRTQDGNWVAPESFVKEVARLFGAEVIQELGQVALDFSELSEEERAPFGLWGGSVARPSASA